MATEAPIPVLTTDSVQPTDQAKDQEKTRLVMSESRHDSNRRIVKNTSIYLVAQIVSWAIQFVNLAVIPRHLGETLIGYLTLASATLAMALSMVTFGVENNLIRAVGRHPEDSERLLRAAFGLRLVTVPFLIGVAFALLWVARVSPAIWTIALLILPSVVLTLFGDCLRSTLNGWEMAARVSLTDMLLVATGFINIPIVILFPNYTGLKLTCMATVGMSFVVLILRYRWVRHQIRLRATFHLAEWKMLIFGGLPFVANTIIMQFYTYSAVLILRHFTDAAAVGVYSQASKLTGSFLFLPSALCAALLPSLSRLAHSDIDEFRQMQRRVLNLLIVLSLPMTVGVILLAAPLCHALYGPHKFTQLPLALQYTALTILPLYIVSTMYQFLVAQNRNAIWTFFMIGTALVYAASSWMLIPITLRVFHNGIVGAVMGTVIAEGASALCALVLLKANPFNRESVNTVARAILATAVMGLAVWFTREALHAAPPLLTLVVGAGVGTTIFLAATFLLHILPAEQEQRLRALIASKLSRKASS